jgi:hypothetical protein
VHQACILRVLLHQAVQPVNHYKRTLRNRFYTRSHSQIPTELHVAGLSVGKHLLVVQLEHNASLVQQLFVLAQHLDAAKQ